jgi:hypothetical protein
LGQTFPIQTADPHVLNRMTFNAHIKADSKNLSVSNGILGLDESKLIFSMKASDFSKPSVKFDLDLNQINLDGYLPPKSDKKSSAKQQDQDSRKEQRICVRTDKKGGLHTIASAYPGWATENPYAHCK